jgi:hypothetical protein
VPVGNDRFAVVPDSIGVSIVKLEGYDLGLWGGLALLDLEIIGLGFTIGKGGVRRDPGLVLTAAIWCVGVATSVAVSIALAPDFECWNDEYLTELIASDKLVTLT